MNFSWDWLTPFLLSLLLLPYTFRHTIEYHSSLLDFSIRTLIYSRPLDPWATLSQKTYYAVSRFDKHQERSGKTCNSKGPLFNQIKPRWVPFWHVKLTLKVLTTFFTLVSSKGLPLVPSVVLVSPTYGSSDVIVYECGPGRTLCNGGIISWVLTTPPPPLRALTSGGGCGRSSNENWTLEYLDVERWTLFRVI